MHYLSNFKGLPKQVYILGIVRVLVGCGNMTFAFASLIFTSVLGLSEFAASLLAMSLALGNALGVTFGGRFSDILGRKKTFLILAAAGIAGSIAGGAFCRTVAVIPFLILSNMCFNGCGPVVAALISDRVSDKNRVESFSFIYLCANLGVAVGPAIGGLFFYNHMAWCFYLQSMVLILVGAYILIFIRDDYRPTESAVRKSSSEKRESTLRLLMQRPAVLGFIVALLVLTVCYQLVNFLLPLQMRDDFGLEISSRLAGRIWTMNGLSIVIFGPMFIGYIKKHHQYVNAATGTLLYAVGYGMYSFVRQPFLYMAAVVIWSIGEILISTGAGAYISENSPETHRGRFQSFYDTSRYIGKAIAPPLFTFAMQFVGHRGSWVLSASICLTVGLILFIFSRSFLREKKETA